MKTSRGFGKGLLLYLVLFVGVLYGVVPAFGQESRGEEEIYWCPMRGNPCEVKDYHGPGQCDDCGMDLITKAAYMETVGKSMADGKKTIGILLYPEFEALDVYGPVEMWSYVPNFELVFVAEEAGPVRSTQGAQTVAAHSFEDCPPLDILMVPGGLGTLPELQNEKLLDFIREQHAETELTTSVCSGSALLAKAGLLDGVKATTNKAYFDQLSATSPDVDWVREARWVEDGKIITSSGVSAGMDMALFLVKRMYGEEMARGIAEGTEYVWNTDPGNDPFAK